MSQTALNPIFSVPLVTARPEPSVNSKITTFILQQTSGTATAGELIEDIDINAEDALFGANSHIATAIREFRKINTVSQINAIALDDAGGSTDATGSIVFAGTATASGTIQVYIGNEDRSYPITVASGATATTVGDSLVALLTADSKALVTGVNTTGSVALTAVNAGTIGNTIGIRVDSSVAGITQTLTAMSGGAGDPSMTGLDALLPERTDVITHDKYTYSTFVTLFDGRFNSDNIPLDGRVFIGAVDTKSNLVTLANAENSQSLVIIGSKPVNKSTKKGSAIFAMPYQRVVNLQAIRTLRLEDNQVITQWLQTNAPKDQFGGPALNSLPLYNSPTLLPVVPSGEGFTTSEVSDLSDAGVSVFGNNTAKNKVVLGKIYTTYKTDSVGNPDKTYEKLSYVDTATACREYILSALKINYSQSRRTKAQGINGRDIVSKGRLRADLKEWYDDLGSVDYALIEWGEIKGTGRTVASIVEENTDIDLSQVGTIALETILPIMTQADQFNMPLGIVFDVNKF